MGSDTSQSVTQVVHDSLRPLAALASVVRNFAIGMPQTNQAGELDIQWCNKQHLLRNMRPQLALPAARPCSAASLPQIACPSRKH